MDFDQLLDQAIEMLQRRGRLTYRTLKRQFQLDDAALEDLKAELLYSQPQIVDDEGRGLIWTGEAVSASSPSPERERPSAPGPEPLSYTPQHLTDKILTSRSALEGERKQVTVLFADIKDSTELIRDLDPEDAQKLLDPAIHIMMDAVHRFEGTVNQVLGDGIMSIFGAPIAHEDHAARACYAALAMQAAMRDYTEEVRRNQGLELRIRVGLNSGEVVVRTIGNDLHMDYSAVGPTTHLAARMEQLATPGSIRLSSATLRLVEGLVQVDALGAVPVKGMTEPVEVYELTGASTIRRRLQAGVARGLTTFVGRNAEIEVLNQALEQAGTGHGQIIAAVGEAGVGKSRLVYEFVHSHHTQGWLVLESASVSYGKATPYFPVIDILKRYVHVEDGDDSRVIRAKVTGQILTLDETLQDTIPPLLSLFDAIPEDSPFLKLDPSQRRQRTLDGLKRTLLRESQVQPLLLVFEDLHWIDSETQALLDSLIENLTTAQLLLLVNYRPEYNHGWGSKTYYTRLRLDPLPPESADALLETLLGDDSGLEPLKKLLVERTEGNPFFLEESVRTLVETQVLVGEPGTYRLEQALPTIQVPPTVQAVLAARIDRLPQSEKWLLQTAAVIGNEVPFTLLQTIAEMPAGALQPCLTHLQSAEFLYETNLFPDRIYTFKHALSHEVAYNSLLQERRRVLHARIVEELQTLAGNRLSEQAERLAYHAFRGEVWDKAVAYYRQAGAKAHRQSAHREAATYWEQALNALQHLPENRETHEQAIDIRLDLQQALLPLNQREWMLDLMRQAEPLATALNDQRRLGWVTVGTCLCLWMLGDGQGAAERGRQALVIGEALEDADLLMAANMRLGQVYHTLNDYRRAIDHLKRNATPWQGEVRPEHFRHIFSRVWLTLCLSQLGRFDEAMVYGQEAIRMAEAIENSFCLSGALSAIGNTHFYKGEFQQAISILERGLTLCDAAHISVYRPMIANTLGAAYTRVGRIPDALPLFTQASTQNFSTRLIHISEGYLRLGRMAEASQHTRRALDLAQAQGARGGEAYALRLLGNLAMYHDPPDFAQADTHYQQALTLASELGMRPLQAHCHRGLGTLYRQIGQAEQACAELSTAIEMYRDMEMTCWLPETEAALAQVEGQ